MVPASVDGQDRTLVDRPDFLMQTAGMRAYPDGVVFHLLILNSAQPELRDVLVQGIAHASNEGQLELGNVQAVPRMDVVLGEVDVQRGGGGDGRFDIEFWIALHPSAETLRLTYVWQVLNVEPGSAEFDVPAIRSAASRARGLSVT